MHFLFVGLQRFYVHTLEPTDKAMVVHRDGFVLDACEKASLRGVAEGMSLHEAKALLREDGLYRPFEAEDYAEARERWLNLCLEFSDGIEPDLPGSAYIDLSAHPEPVDIANRLLTALNRPFRAALADAKWVARLAARTNLLPTLKVVTSSKEFLKPLPTGLLLPALPLSRQRLEFLGYRRIGDVARAPIRALKEQFGKEGIVIQRAANGLLGDRVVPSYPPDSVSERLAFDGRVESTLELQAGARELADRLSQRLLTMDREGGEVHLFVEFEERTERSFKQLAKPAQKAETLRVVLEHLLGKVELSEPVIAVRAMMPKLKPAGVRQYAFEPSTKPRERQKVAETTLLRIQTAYGSASVQKASEVEVSRRIQVMRAWQNATGWS